MTVYRDAPRSIRFFCVVGPTGLVAADTGHAFLRALEDARLHVRALPIGPGGIFLVERKWYQLGVAFTRPMQLPYINIVCAKAGELMGTATPASTFAKADALPPELRELLARDGFVPGSKSADVEYTPTTVFSSLYTVGVPNVAIVIGVPDGAELRVLGRYDLVIWPEATDEDTVRARHASPLAMQSWYIPPAQAQRLPGILREVLRCEFATTVTTEPSPDTDARRATTSPRSSSPTSNLRSPRSPSGSPAPSHAIDISTVWWRRGLMPQLRAMWRSITRNLAFWRRWRKRATSDEPKASRTSR